MSLCCLWKCKVAQRSKAPPVTVRSSSLRHFRMNLYACVARFSVTPTLALWFFCVAGVERVLKCFRWVYGVLTGRIQ